MKKEKLPKDESKSKSKDIKDTANDKIRAILTPDQQKIFDKTVKKGNKNKDKAPGTTPTATPGAAPGSPTP